MRVIEQRRAIAPPLILKGTGALDEYAHVRRPTHVIGGVRWLAGDKQRRPQLPRIAVASTGAGIGSAAARATGQDHHAAFAVINHLRARTSLAGPNRRDADPTRSGDVFVASLAGLDGFTDPSHHDDAFAPFVISHGHLRATRRSRSAILPSGVRTHFPNLIAISSAFTKTAHEHKGRSFRIECHPGSGRGRPGPKAAPVRPVPRPGVGVSMEKNYLIDWIPDHRMAGIVRHVGGLGLQLPEAAGPVAGIDPRVGIFRPRIKTSTGRRGYRISPEHDD